MRWRGNDRAWRWWRWPILITAGVVIGFLILKEHKEPFLWLYVDDVIHPKLAPITNSLGDGLALRWYQDTRPHVGKIAGLQKGAVLLVEGEPVVEEGYGFGLPLVVVAGQAYNSRSASLTAVEGVLVKRYQMDTIDTPSGFLKTKYLPVASIGSVVVTYTVTAGAVEVAVDFSDLAVEWDRAYLMNEQGAVAFTRYEGPEAVLEGDELGIWQQTSGRRGCIVSADRKVRFCVETDDDSSRYVGRERYNQYYWLGVYCLSWTGIDIELPGSALRYTYRVRVERESGDEPAR